MKKLLTVVLLSTVLISCTKPNTDTPGAVDISTSILQKTEGLEDCILYKFKADKYQHPLNIVRCDVPTTTTNAIVSAGKTSRVETVVIIDGKKYKEVE